MQKKKRKNAALGIVTATGILVSLAGYTFTNKHTNAASNGLASNGLAANQKVEKELVLKAPIVPNKEVQVHKQKTLEVAATKTAVPSSKKMKEVNNSKEIVKPKEKVIMPKKEVAPKEASTKSDATRQTISTNVQKPKVTANAATNKMVINQPIQSANHTPVSTPQKVQQTNEQNKKEVFKETMGVYTGRIDTNSIEMDIEGNFWVFNAGGNPEIQTKLNELKEGQNVVIRFVETPEGQKLIKYLFVVYDPQEGDLSEFIYADYFAMIDPHTIEVYVDHKPQTFQLSNDLIGKDLDKEFAPGEKVCLAGVKTKNGLVIERISSLE